MADEPKDDRTDSPKKRRATRRKRRSKKKKGEGAKRGGATLTYPKHHILQALRIPQAVLTNNAGKDCTDRDAVKFAGLGWSGVYATEISSALKYGLLQRPTAGRVEPTERTRRIFRPQKPHDKRDAIREGVLSAPVVGDVYRHYRGENLPEDRSFLANTVTESFWHPSGEGG